eukprot:TRINITY_DN72457_c0_g1_i1.p1 TRINITY_DN72457_c0_g1~~TRINITY_DN72457_c0_g1_i1.p1  ORF type:complete len:619 (-),score=98.84 TRINITY_DN72457_c0_g1_i1:206-2062(-)
MLSFLCCTGRDNGVDKSVQSGSSPAFAVPDDQCASAAASTKATSSGESETPSALAPLALDKDCDGPLDDGANSSDKAGCDAELAPSPQKKKKNEASVTTAAQEASIVVEEKADGKGKTKGNGKAAPPPPAAAKKGNGKVAPPPPPSATKGNGKAAPPPTPSAIKGNGKASPPAPVPPNQKGKGDGTKKSWKEKAAEKAAQKAVAEPLPVTSWPPGPLDAPRWETAFVAESSEAGSVGVIFVATYAGVFVVKSSAQPAQEYFASLVLRRLGVPAPPVRIVDWPRPEFDHMKASIRAAGQLMKARGDDSGAQRVLWRLGPREQGRPQMLITRLVPSSKQLEGHPDAAKLLDVDGTEGAMRDEAKMRLQAMGRCLATDILLNNSDRMPASCWDNEGNAGNLMLPRNIETAQSMGGSAGGGLVAIDNILTCIRSDVPAAKANLEQYIERARSFLLACVEVTDSVALQHTFAPLCAFMQVNFAYTPSLSALSEIRVGVLQVIADIGAPACNGELSFPDWLASTRVELSTMVETDWGNVWRDSVNLVDDAFLKSMSNLFLEIASTYTDSLPEPSATRNLLHENHQSTSELVNDMLLALWNVLPSSLQTELMARKSGPEESAHQN